MKTWCIPPKANADCVWHREDVLHTDQLPYNPSIPVVCMDEASKQRIGAVPEPLPVQPGKPRGADDAYERQGVCNAFVCCEPLRGWRHVKVTDRRTKRDGAACMREWWEGHCPQAPLMRLGLDNLNTHTGASLDEAFSPRRARQLLDRLAFHHTPKHASWLNMAAIESGIMHRQCLHRRIDDGEVLRRAIAVWEDKRNQAAAKIHWTFTIAVARTKLKKLYPDWKGVQETNE